MHLQRRIAGRTARDEAVCKRVHLIGRQRDVEGLREGDLADGVADVGIVAGFDGENGACCGEIGRVAGDLRCGAEISTHADAFEDAGGGEKGVGGQGAEVVGALFDGGSVDGFEGDMLVEGTSGEI